MNDADFICGLMRHNTDDVGFITRPTIEERFIRRGLYVIQRDRLCRPIGYLVNGPVHKDLHCQIHQACIELDRRNRHFGIQAVQTMIDRAIQHGARTITLRCGTDLAAVKFWTAIGFIPYAFVAGGRRRARTIVHFALDLRKYHPPATRFLSPAIAGGLVFPTWSLTAHLVPSIHTMATEGGNRRRNSARTKPAALPHPPTQI